MSETAQPVVSRHDCHGAALLGQFGSGFLLSAPHAALQPGSEHSLRHGIHVALGKEQLRAHLGPGRVCKLAMTAVPGDLSEHPGDEGRLWPQSVRGNPDGLKNGEHLQEGKALRVGRCRQDVPSPVWPNQRRGDFAAVPLQVCQAHDRAETRKPADQPSADGPTVERSWPVAGDEA